MRATAGRRVVLAVLAVAILTASLAVPPGESTAQEVDESSTTLAFALQTDGDARVAITTRFPLASSADRAGFDRLARGHTSGTDSPLSAAPFVEAADRSAEANGRPMAVESIARTASRTNDTGQLSIRFTWTNFAEPREEGLAVGDAFRTPNGTWLPRIAADQELRISFPEDYSPQRIAIPETRYQLVNRTVVIEGPASFEPGTPQIVLQEAEPPSGPPWTLLTGAAVAVALVAIVAYLFRDRIRAAVGGLLDDGGEEAGSEATGDTTEAADEPDPMAEPLLSDEERVVKLLSARGGRMKQVEIVEATDWSNAKVSQLLSQMESNGRIDKLRIGRENLISLPGRGPGEE